MTEWSASSLALHRAPVPRAALQFASLGARPKLSRSALAAVVLLHAVLIHLLVTGMRHAAPDSLSKPFTVEWIAARPSDSELPVPPWPELPDRSRAREVATQPDVSPIGKGEVAEATSAGATSEASAESRLFDGTGRPRIVADPTVPRWTDSDRILRDRIVKLPGDSDAQAAYQVRLRMRAVRTPEDIVVSVLRLLFGRPVVDDCRTIEQRLINGDPGVSREIDLVKLRKTCVGNP